MSIKNAQARLDLIRDYTIGTNDSNGNKQIIRKLRKMHNVAETKIIMDTDVFSSQLNAQYKARTGKKPNDNVIKKYKKLSQAILKRWNDEVKDHPEDYFFIRDDGADLLHFGIKAGLNRRKTPRDNYALFRRKNQEFTLKLIKTSTYNQLFRGRTKNKSGAKRQIFDVGHVYSITEKGRAGLAAGMAQEALTGEDGVELQAKDFQNEDQYRQLKALTTTLNLRSEEILQVSVTNRNVKFTSEVRIDLELNSDTSNKGKAAAERKLGEGVRNEISKIIGQKHTAIHNKKIANQKGSPSMMEEIGNLIVNSPIKRAAYRKKTGLNSTKYKRVPKSYNKKSAAKSGRKINTERAVIHAAGITREIASRLPRPSTSKGSTTTEKGQGSTDFAIATAGLLAVKKAINKRLPEEVRKNMGRPALNYRTGRFARSTQVESITPTARTLMVKYTYRLNPYETFENTGKKRWPTGYNPKPVISKSIRELALAMFKITALTTRRV